MDYNDALNVIKNKQSLGIKPGLTRMNKLMELMDYPQEKIKIIHIAGTNGKGTVAATIANELANNGFKVGLFTSPWITEYNEQIQINGKCISNDDLADYIEKYKDTDSTEFELITAIMYKYFYDNNVDYAVVECGMGGAGDATNVEKRNISVITSISLDHIDFFGDSIEAIALEKAGIIKESSACILYPNDKIKYIFEDKCKLTNSKLILVNEFFDIDKNNLATVNALLKSLDLESEIKADSLVKLPARCEYKNGVLLDGGHNTSAAKRLNEFIDNEIAVIGMMKDKNVDEYLSIIAPKCKMIIATTPNNPRAMKSVNLMEIALKYCDNVVDVENPIDAIELGKKYGLSLVCGSLYLSREVRNIL